MDTKSSSNTHETDAQLAKKEQEQSNKEALNVADLLTCSSIRASICLCERPIFTQHPCSQQTLLTHTHTHTHTCLARVLLPGCCRCKAESRMIRSIQTSSTDCLSDTLSTLSLLLSLSFSLSLPSYSLLHFTLPLHSVSQSVSQSVLLTFLRQI